MAIGEAQRRRERQPLFLKGNGLMGIAEHAGRDSEVTQVRRYRRAQAVLAGKREGLLETDRRSFWLVGVKPGASSCRQRQLEPLRVGQFPRQNLCLRGSRQGSRHVPRDLRQVSRNLQGLGTQPIRRSLRQGEGTIQPIRPLVKRTTAPPKTVRLNGEFQGNFGQSRLRGPYERCPQVPRSTSNRSSQAA